MDTEIGGRIALRGVSGMGTASDIAGSKSLRIAVIFDNLGPYHVARLAAAAGRADITCIEVTACSADYAWQRIEQVPFSHVVLFKKEDTPPTAELRRRLDAALNATAPDVLAVPGWSHPASLAALRWSATNDIPTVVMSESTAIDATRYQAVEFIKGLIVKLNAAALVGGTASADYVERLGMPRERIFWGYDAVDNAYFEAGAVRARENAAAERVALALPVRFFLTTCRLVDKKNLHRLIQAYAEYRRLAGRDQLDLVIVGDGPLRAELIAMRDVLGLGQHVHMPGFVQYPDLPRYYGLATVFVLASTVEQWGLVVNEALASGLPVIVSDRCGCAPDLVQQGVNGYTCDPYSTGDMAAALANVAHGSNLRAMGAASRAIAAEWTVERFAQGLHDAATAARVRGKAPNASLLGLLKPLTG